MIQRKSIYILVVDARKEGESWRSPPGEPPTVVAFQNSKKTTHINSSYIYIHKRLLPSQGRRESAPKCRLLNTDYRLQTTDVCPLVSTVASTRTADGVEAVRVAKACIG